MRVSQIVRRHGHPELHLGVEVEEPWLGEPGNVRRAVEVDDENAAAAAIDLAKVRRLRLRIIENLLDFGPRSAILDRGIERFKRATEPA